MADEKNVDNIIGCLEARVERTEGKAEDRLAFISRSPAMARVNEWMNVLRRDSMRNEGKEATILLVGESGTGKEGIARMCHVTSRRGRGPWVTVNCSLMNSQQIESDLFGYERGAFNGATSAKRGAFEIARGGTLYLDGADHMDTALQAKVFAAIQAGSFTTMGGSEKIEMEVRLISSVSTDIQKKVSDSAFRYDLYQVLGSVIIEMPNLRERADDVVLMATQFAERSFKSQGKIFAGFSPEAQEGLKSYGWPGNEAELLTVVERTALIHHGNQPVGLRTLMLSVGAQGSNGAKLELVSSNGTTTEYGYMMLKKKYSDSFEKEYLVATLARNGGNVSAAAREAQLDRSNFLRLLRRHGLRAQEYRKAA